MRRLCEDRGLEFYYFLPAGGSYHSGAWPELGNLLRKFDGTQTYVCTPSGSRSLFKPFSAVLTQLSRKREMRADKPPTERQAAAAAKQLLYHERLSTYIANRMLANEETVARFLSEVLVQTGEREAVIRGGFKLSRGDSGGVRVEALGPSGTHEQLTLDIDGEREAA